MKNRGITLISLIVTIIIMIILAAVTVNLITNGGIIAKARETAEDYKLKAEQEAVDLAIASGKDYVTGEIDTDKVQDILGDDWEVDIDGDEIIVMSPDGNEYIEELVLDDEEEKDDGDIIIGSSQIFDLITNSKEYRDLIEEKPNLDISGKKSLLQGNVYGINDVNKGVLESCTTIEQVKAQVDEEEFCDANGSDENFGALVYVNKNADKVIIYAEWGEGEEENTLNFGCIEAEVVEINDEQFMLKAANDETIVPEFISRDRMEAYLHF